MHPFEGSNRMMASDVTDFPDPDSPTMPRVSPLLILRETSFTAVVHPVSELNETVSSDNCSKGTFSINELSELFSKVRILATARQNRNTGEEGYQISQLSIPESE